MNNQQTLPGVIDVNEAPEGYYAALKSSVPDHVGNICRACDFRPRCPSGPVNLIDPLQNCRGHELIGTDGKIYVRKDRCHVIFKVKK